MRECARVAVSFIVPQHVAKLFANLPTCQVGAGRGDPGVGQRWLNGGQALALRSVGNVRLRKGGRRDRGLANAGADADADAASSKCGLPQEKPPENGGQAKLLSRIRVETGLFAGFLGVLVFATCANADRDALRARQRWQKLALTAISDGFFEMEDHTLPR